jgi:chromate transporter
MNKNHQYLFFKFLKIGATSWGGYMALIAMIEKQFCQIDKAIEEEKVVHAISLASVLPGPVAVNVVAYIGYQLKGIKGALVSMIAVLIPCFVLMVALSYVYLSYGNIPAFNNFFTGITPAVAALLISVAVTMSKKNVKDVAQIIIAVAALLSIFFIHSAYTTILVVVISAVAGYIIYNKKIAAVHVEETNRMQIKVSKKFLRTLALIVVPIIVLITVYFLFDQYSSVQLYKQILITFSGLSISQFGGGYVVIPAMQKVIVDSLHWLTGKQFTDAIAMGQITPGPIYISSTFIGYKLDGITGAFISTAAMFLPAACIMLLCTKFMDAIITSPVVKACFKGVTAAVAGMIAAAGCTIFYKMPNISVSLISIFIISLVLFVRFKVNPVYIIPLAGVAGLLIF